MNFQCSRPFIPLRVLILNPLLTASQMIATKILSGHIFGFEQTVHLKLLVQTSDLDDAESLKIEFEKCAFHCTSSIEILTDVPCIKDADVFCIISNLPNPNSMNIEILENTDELHDTLYLLIKTAHGLSCPDPEVLTTETIDKPENVMKVSEEEPKPIKPIIFADGLVALDILKSISVNIPHDVFFCPTHLPTIARSVLAEHLKVQISSINNALIWAVNDEMIHVEIEKPMFITNKPKNMKCEWDMISKGFLKKLTVNGKELNASWMKKEYIQKIRSNAQKNPYGSIFYASNFAQNLKNVWATRLTEETKIISVGVISDGSLETIKGLPYVLPLEFRKESWSVDKRLQNDVYLKHEIIKLNKVIKRQHDYVIPYCKKFLEQHVIKPEEVRDEETISESMKVICYE